MVNKNNFIERLKHKDLRALDYLVDSYSDLALKVSYSVLNNRQLSEECSNDVLFKIWDNISYFKGNTKDFDKWIVVITKRQAIDILRKERRHNNNLELKEELSYDTQDRTFEEVNKILEKEKLKFNLEGLSKSNKEMIFRRYFRDESLDEISSELGIEKSAVSNRLLRIRKKLKQIFVKGEL